VPTLLSDSGSELGRPGAFVLGDNHLYQVEIFHNAVTRETTDGNQKGLLEDGVTRQFYAPDQIAVMQSGLVTDAIGLIDDHVVWAVGPSIFRKSGNLLWGDPAQLVATTVGGGKVTGFVVSDGFVYFGEGNSDTIQVAAAYDGVPQVIATGQKSPTQFAADDHALYWRTYDCNIMKLAK